MKLATAICGLGVLLCAQLALAGPATSFKGWNMDAGQNQSQESATVSSTAGQQVVLHLKAGSTATNCQALWSMLPNGQPTPLATETFVIVTPTVSTTYTARCFDQTGATDAAVAVTVGSSGGVDTIPPAVAFVVPANNATVFGNTIIAINANDNVGVVGVLVSLDGTALGAELVQAPYNINWNTASATNGNHTLTARARDAAGNSNQVSVAVVVSNGGVDIQPPTVQITTPYAGQTVSGNVTVTATASDNAGVAWVKFQLDGTDIPGAILTAAPYTFVWNTVNFANGPHTLLAVARDTTGNTATYFIGVTINNATTPFAVLNPTAGQSYQTGNQIIVAWTPHPQATGYAVWFNYGNTYTQLTTAPLPATITTFGWTPTAAVASGKIQIVAYLPNGLTVQADSGTFTITQAVDVLLVTAPIGGAEFATGTPITVAWKPRFDLAVSHYLVDFSTNAGNLWSTVSPSLASGTLTYTYTPTMPTLLGKFRVMAMLTNGSAIFAESAIFRVTQTTPVPTFKITDVVNAADTDPATATRGVLVPGAWFSIYGTNFAANEVRAATIPYPTRLGDIEVLVNGQAAPLWFVRTDQINFQVPYGITGSATLQVVNRQGAVSQVFTLPVRTAAPSLFKYKQSDEVIRPIVQNWTTGQMVDPLAPMSLSAGRFIILYGNAFGPVADQWKLFTGQASPASRLLDQTTTFVVDGAVQQPAQTTYVGLAPGMAGVFQVNLQLPADLSAGRHAGVLVINNSTVLPFEFWTN